VRFLITNREGIERGVEVDSNYVIVSIHDPERQPARIPQRDELRETLSIAFHDAVPLPGMPDPEGVELISAVQADQIVAFAMKWAPQIGTIVCHCEQGMSRSPGVAAALCRAMGQDDSFFFAEYQPNDYVRQMVLAAAVRASQNQPNP